MDSHVPTQTVREAIECSAALRLPPHLAVPDERARRVEAVIDALPVVVVIVVCVRISGRLTRHTYPYILLCFRFTRENNNILLPHSSPPLFSFYS